MPLIIQAKDYDRRLTADPTRPPIDLPRPFDADKMTAWNVDRAVGNVMNDSPELIAPVSLPPHNLEDALRIGLDRSSYKVNSCETDRQRLWRS
jgi:hypothetical protein